MNAEKARLRENARFRLKIAKVVIRGMMLTVAMSNQR